MLVDRLEFYVDQRLGNGYEVAETSEDLFNTTYLGSSEVRAGSENRIQNAKASNLSNHISTLGAAARQSGKKRAVFVRFQRLMRML